jgi:hypothetical protein
MAKAVIPSMRQLVVKSPSRSASAAVSVVMKRSRILTRTRLCLRFQTNLEEQLLLKYKMHSAFSAAKNPLLFA